MKVSILIPCFNAERWIGQAILSALNQSHGDKEVIVVDDGSTDKSLEIIQSFGNRICFETGPNRGGNTARNRLLELAQGEWLQYLDADDYLLPDKIAQQLPYSANADVVYSRFTLEIWQKDGTYIQETGPVTPQGDLWLRLLGSGITQTGAVLWRRQAIEDVGGWNPKFTSVQEVEIFFRLLSENKRFVYCPTLGAVYRRKHEPVTLSNRDPYRSLLNLMHIAEGAKGHFVRSGQMTPARQNATSVAIVSIARRLYPFDRKLALGLLKRSHSPHRKKLPADSFSPALLASYRWIGFQFTETLAAYTRRARHSMRKRARYFLLPFFASVRRGAVRSPGATL